MLPSGRISQFGATGVRSDAGGEGTGGCKGSGADMISYDQNALIQTLDRNAVRSEEGTAPTNVTNAYSGQWTGLRGKVYNGTAESGTFSMDLKAIGITHDRLNHFHFVEVHIHYV